MSSIDPHQRRTPTRYPMQDNDRPKATSRLIHSVKRSLSQSSRPHPPHSKSAMQSTSAESASPVPPQQQQFREADPAPSRPTIEQIAMGLHISRTPHLRPLASSPYAFSQPNSSHHHRATPITLPPPPTRSSMKKPATTVTSSSSSPAVSPPFSAASGSTTTVTSAAPSAAGHSARPFAAIKFRMARFLPHTRSASAPPPMGPSPTSPRDSAQPKKAVRFEQSDEGD